MSGRTEGGFPKIIAWDARKLVFTQTIARLDGGMITFDDVTTDITVVNPSTGSACSDRLGCCGRSSLFGQVQPQSDEQADPRESAQNPQEPGRLSS
jgi:hypothetical protein